MNRDEAQARLRAYQPGSADDHDPRFAEARARLERDAELRSWFEQERRFDAAVRERLGAVPPPPGLLPRLLAARGRPTVGRRASVWQLPLALAASLALLLGLGFYGWKATREPVTPLSACRTHLAEWLRQFPRLDLESEQLAEVKAWLAARGVTDEVSVPTGLQQFPTIGCRQLDWQGRSVSLICFMVDGDVMHLVVVSGPPLEGVAAQGDYRFARAGEFRTAAWSRAGATYLLLTRAPANALRRVLVS